jgi:integrase
LSKLQWSHVNIDAKEVVIPPQVAKGGKRRRFVTLSDNAIAWLEAYRQAGGLFEGPVTIYARSLLTKNRRKLQAVAGVNRWIQAGPRHSYCSYWLAKFEDVNKLVLQSGHTDASTMWEHYHAGATKADAERFWSIAPSGTPTNVVAFERSA